MRPANGDELEMKPDRSTRRHTIYHWTIAYTALMVTVVFLILIFGGHS